MTAAAGLALLLTGAAILVLAAAGLFVFRDALSRQHAATKAGSLGIAAVTLGAALAGSTLGGWLRALLIVLVVWATQPVASHVLARAAARAAGHRRTGAPQRTPGPRTTATEPCGDGDKSPTRRG